ncbi:RimJ/RimL family protein N-acetyltransferase [Actinoplanes octamycinicus]|uniref:RimJ/RimL family protein N-acetyltransferase n=1 Tax=Actinoplanes octamycinicus TaxID=135948 RepID=A0A7W7M556_9ACTN|nr:GNAT family N-acetyltransferase [Actinoplanes octamycinicus]MBB4737373.1 RimJ/RimL family protein N-acetyltransferase [Actinoplanes octamycinicus]GIE60342.1 acetyltransferase [Actinoplanes octamycinicus]
MPSLVTPALAAGTLAASAQPEIAGDGVLLRPWQASDRPAVVAGYADPAIQRWHCRSMTEDEAAAWIARWPDRWRDETGAGWAIVDTRTPDRVAGQISFRRIDLGEAIAELSYWVLPEFRGRRIAPRALHALTGWAFAELGLYRLELNHSTANTASCRVAAQAGYPVEGTKRGEARHADGWHDMHQHARLAID